MENVIADALDPQVAALLEMIWALPPLESMNVQEMREQIHNFAMLAGAAEPMHSVEDRPIPGPAGPIPVRVYRPSDAPNLPVFIYFHGGGWALGDLDFMDSPVRLIRNRSGWMAVSVDYRLAPENKFPAAVDDAFAAVKWVAEHGAEIGGDGSRIAVGGDSAGGNLSAVVCLLAKAAGGPKISFQALIYPATDASKVSDSWKEFGPKNYILSFEHLKFFHDAYVAGSGFDTTDPRISPALSPDLSGLPPALVITAEFDPLRDEGNAYAGLLKQAGVSVRLHEYPGMVHGFCTMGAMVDAGNEANAEIADALKHLTS